MPNLLDSALQAALASGDRVSVSAQGDTHYGIVTALSNKNVTMIDASLHTVVMDRDALTSVTS
jgi:hypothetical protein